MNTITTFLIITISIVVYYVINSFILKNELKKYTSQYRTYFQKDHIKKQPFLYIFFTMFMFLYNKYHKDEIEYGFLKYKIDAIDRIKTDIYFNSIQQSYGIKFEIEGEDEIRKKFKNYSLKIKLKKLNNNNNGDK